MLKKKNYKKKVNRNHVYYGSPLKIKGTPIKKNLSRLLKQDKKLRGKIRELKSMVKYCGSQYASTDDECQTKLKFQILEQQKALENLHNAEFKLRAVEVENGNLLELLRESQKKDKELGKVSKEISFIIDTSAKKMKEERENLEKTIDELKQQLQRKNSENLELQDKEQICSNEKGELKKQNDDLATQLQSLKDENKNLAKIKTELEALKTQKGLTDVQKIEIESELQNLQQAQNKNKKEMEELSIKITTCNEEKNTLKTENEQLNKNLSELQQQIKDLEEVKKELGELTNIHDLDKIEVARKTEELKKIRADYEKFRIEMERSLKENEQKYSKLLDQERINNSKLKTQWEAEKSNLNASIEESEKLEQTCQLNLQETNLTLSDKKKYIDQIIKEKEDLTKQVSLLLSKLNRMEQVEKENNQYEIEINTQEQEILQLKQLNEELKVKNEKLIKEMDEAEKFLTEINEEKFEIDKSLKQTQKKLQEYMKENVVVEGREAQAKAEEERREAEEEREAEEKRRLEEELESEERKEREKEAQLSAALVQPVSDDVFKFTEDDFLKLETNSTPLTKELIDAYRNCRTISSQIYKIINDYIEKEILTDGFDYRAKINFLEYKIEHNINCSSNYKTKKNVKTEELKEKIVTENEELKLMIKKTKTQYLEYLKK